ncbi:hypothetical protein AWV80_09035 [Cupriavidus sp. UYMU48A]|nr:hypothetical protein AWV80_09035 [Cupriavidus sp. UYMU48A]
MLWQPGREQWLKPASIPKEWREALGSYAHTYLLEREAEARGIRVKRVTDQAGWHFEYTGGRT